MSNNDLREVKQTNNNWKGIKARRKAKGWTQEMLAEITGIHRVTIARYETAGGDMTVENAEKLAKALGCTISDLRGTEDE